MTPRSQSLFHLTGKRAHLEQMLLRGGFWPRYCNEENFWRAHTARGSNQKMWLPIVCFCDIPLTRLDEHTEWYGRFGLGMSQEWGKRVKLHPVAYIDTGGPLSAPFNDVRMRVDYNVWTDATGFMKPLNGKQKDRTGVVRDKDFYAESEWRYLARHDQINPRIMVPGHVVERPEAKIDAWIEDENAKTLQHCLLTFEPADVRYIFVESDGDIPAVADTILASDFNKRDPAAARVLISRITSLATIRLDF